ncbi:DNA repair helicase [Atractiella rhizophila]|nr:DNA repair helicase [Atractiella rhizophila]
MLGVKKRKRGVEAENERAEENWLLEDKREDAIGTDGLSNRVREMLQKQKAELFSDSSAKNKWFTDPKAAHYAPNGRLLVSKVYLASRTHSQLSQMLQELSKTHFPEQGLRVLALGSRKHLCVHEGVRDREDVNEVCLEMQRAGNKRCPYLPKMDDPTDPLLTFADEAFATPHDIESLLALGQAHKLCSYYGARRALPFAQLVLLPYPLLLSAEARDSLGIPLDKDGTCVVIDEAHNLLPTLLQMHSVSIGAHQIRLIGTATATYVAKWGRRMKGTNEEKIKTLEVVIRRLQQWMTKDKAGDAKEQIWKVAEAVEEMRLQNVDLGSLDQWMTDVKVVRKIGGYADLLSSEAAAEGIESKKRKRGEERVRAHTEASRAFFALQSFLRALSNPSKDGRIIIGEEGGTRTIKYLLLNPAGVFRDVVEEARSVVLAGGTMHPTDEVIHQIFPRRDVQVFAYDHIVPNQHLCVRTIGKGPKGERMAFTYEKRNDGNLMDELGRTIINIGNLVKEGVVVFFPSYDFLKKVKKRWMESGIWARLEGKKKVFEEPKNGNQVDAVLAGYAESVKQKQGVIMFAVVGAKLSEGINFSDDLARTVVVCGIPYPNANSPELNERIKYVNELNGGEEAGRQLYQNIAFKAVNQSIGRAIRHANDWASIILIDERYSSKAVKSKLPGWLGGQSIKTCESFGELVRDLAGFLKERRRTSNS